jgi:AraC-like DNA-binding protein
LKFHHKNIIFPAILLQTSEQSDQTAVFPNSFSNFVNVILLLAGAQGVLLSVLLFHKHGRLLANRLLAYMIFFYSLVLLDLMLWEVGAYKNNVYLALILHGLPFLIAPLHYLYVKYLTQSAGHFNRGDWLHFTPFLLYRLYLTPFFMSSWKKFLEDVLYLQTGLTVDDFLFNWSVIIQGIVYMVLALRLIRQYSLHLTDVFSSPDKIRITWVRNITLIALSVFILFLVENIFMLAGINVSDFFNLSSFVAAVAIYAMGYWGLLRAEIFSQPGIAESICQMQQMALDDNIKGQESPKYSKSGLSEEKAARYEQTLMRLMESDQPYRDANLTLHKLASLLNISPHNLSELINTRLHQSFFDFINTYRVEEVKKNIHRPDKHHLTLLALGFEAGFNSKSSFNAIFKKHTGLTPSQYRKHG